MARSHHRKKHKAHLKQFRQSHDTSNSAAAKGKAAWVIAIGGAIAGFAISYFASGGNWIWMVITTLAGGWGGYRIGKKMDEDNSKG